MERRLCQSQNTSPHNTKDTSQTLLLVLLYEMCYTNNLLLFIQKTDYGGTLEFPRHSWFVWYIDV